MQDKRKTAYAAALVRLISENEEASSAYIDSFIEALRERGEEKLIAPVLAIVKERLGDGAVDCAYIALGDEDSKGAALADARTGGFTGGAVSITKDDSLIGGYRIITKNRLIDSSFKGALLSLYKNLTR